MQIDFEPVGRRVEVRGGSVLEGARQAGVQLVGICGGEGTCGTCQVRLISGKLTPVTADESLYLSPEDLDRGLRLACQCTPLGDVVIDIPPGSLSTPQRTQIEGLEMGCEVDPIVIGVDVAIDPPGADDLRADSSRFISALDDLHLAEARPGAAVLSRISEDLRAGGWSVRAAVDITKTSPLVLAVLPTGTPLYGLAVDIGTTKLAAYLVDLATGSTAARVGGMNPQIAFGEDVVARIAYCNQHEQGRKLLQTRLIETLNSLLTDLCTQGGISARQVVAAAAVGNTVMHHLLAGFPVQQLGASPYVPAVGEAVEISAERIGLDIHPGAAIYLPPNIAGYVGADHVAMLLATEAWKAERTTIAMDIGTNTEISLVTGGKIFACSCASGPAFEGAHIHAGMRAAEGAIERIQIRGGKAAYQTIGKSAPAGICGSGILDGVAQMLADGIIDRRGALKQSVPGVRLRNGKTEYVLVPGAKSASGEDIVIKRADINQIQLAKAAIRIGVGVLLQKAGIDAQQIEDFIIAGAFGTYLDIENALRIGMFPDLPVSRFRQVGNAAGTGARELLISRQKRAEADEIAGRVEYVELTTYPNFTNQFVDAMYF